MRKKWGNLTRKEEIRDKLPPSLSRGSALLINETENKQELQRHLLEMKDSLKSKLC